MEIKNSKEIISLKGKLRLAGVKGLALDIDETLSWTLGYWVERILSKLGNPENLTIREITDKYRYLEDMPYWSGDEVKELVKEFDNSNEVQYKLPLIENVNLIVQEINKIVPIVAYITVRNDNIIDGTRRWLAKHNFPEAQIIAKPVGLPKSEGNKWKAEILEYLYPQVVGIVDDNPRLPGFLSKKYKGVIFLYKNNKVERNNIKVIPCENWETVAEKIKKCRL